MSGWTVLFVLISIAVASAACYFAYKWQAAEQARIDDRAVFMRMLADPGAQPLDAPPPDAPPKTIRIARDGAAGLALIAIATAGWMVTHPRIGMVAALVAASTAALIVLAPPTATPGHPARRPQGIHATRPGPQSTSTAPVTPGPTIAPSALAAPGPEETGNEQLAAAGYTPPSATTSRAVPTTTASAPAGTSTPPTTTVTPPPSTSVPASCLVHVDLLHVVNVCLG